MLSIQALVVLVFVTCAYGVDKGVHKLQNVGIIGGHKISIDKVPYIVSIRLNGTYHWCGGSIIHEQFILTAAHCIVPNRKYKVLVGTDRVDEGGTLFNVEKILIHQKYSNKTFDYDICILKLKEPLTFGPKVDKISLKVDTVKLKKGMLLNITGWGYTKPNGKVSQSLQQVAVPMVPRRKCQMAYSIQQRITPRMLCAGGQGKDACQGDSGGPLTLNNVQVGVTSFGAGCGVVPGVYSKILALHRWITGTIEKNL